MGDGIKGSVKIGGMRYRVQRVKGPIQVNEDGSQIIGRIDNIDNTIKLTSGMAPDRMKVTLIHELIHGVLDSAGISNHDEALIDALAAGLHQIHTDNKWINEMYTTKNKKNSEKKKAGK